MSFYSKAEVIEFLDNGSFYSASRPIDLNKFFRENDSYSILEEGNILFVENVKTRFRQIFYIIDGSDAHAFYKVNSSRKVVKNNRR